MIPRFLFEFLYRMISRVFSGVMRRVLVLGSGYTAAPLVEYLTRQGDIAVTVASDVLPQAEQIARAYQNTLAVKLDINSDREYLNYLIGKTELVIGFVPYTLHPYIAKQCLKARKSLITTSYVSEEMQSLHEAAASEGLTFINEIGVDPGIDHMLAMQCFDEVHTKGGKIISFESWCGGLPHPQYCNNPLKYKFSWSPSGVLRVSKNPAKFYKDGQLKQIAEGTIMEKENLLTFGSNEAPSPEMDFEGYYNRDSTKYVDIYNIPEAKTVLRGTYRYKGFCKVMAAISRLGLLDTSQRDSLQPGSTSNMTWKELIAYLTNINEQNLKSKLLEAAHGDEDTVQIVTGEVPKKSTVLDSTSTYLEPILKYSDGEQDAIYLDHYIGISWPGNKTERRKINLTMFGTFGKEKQYPAMADSVGKPAAIAAKMILNGQVTGKGVIIPTSKEIYAPVLEALKEEGINAEIASEF